jgi:hypothetical protein
MKNVILYRHNEAAGSGPWLKKKPTPGEKALIADGKFDDVLEEIFYEYDCAKGEHCRGLEGYVVEESLADTVIDTERRYKEYRHAAFERGLIPHQPKGKPLMLVTSKEFHARAYKKRLRRFDEVSHG